MNAFYEWDVEVCTDDEFEDIEDHLFQRDYAGCLKELQQGATYDGTKKRIVLVRDDEKGRSWAYLEDGKLPEHFLDAYSNETAKVPKQFRDEVTAA